MHTFKVSSIDVCREDGDSYQGSEKRQRFRIARAQERGERERDFVADTNHKDRGRESGKRGGTTKNEMTSFEFDDAKVCL